MRKKRSLAVVCFLRRPKPGDLELLFHAQSGKSAEIIAFRGDPLDYIRSLQHVLFVMKEGKVFKQEK